MTVPAGRADIRTGVSWESLLRALVSVAFDARDAGDDGAFRAACREIVDEHIRWPLTETLLERREARAIVEARRRWVAESVELMRASYV
jgi:hypothetical protein